VLEASKSGPFHDQSRGSQGQTRPMSDISSDGEAKPDAEKNPEEVAAEQSKVPGAKKKARTEAGTISRQPQNRTVRFPELDHPISVASSQKQPLRTTVPGTAASPRWCPLGLMPS
jgi:hypothetical protein